MKTRRLIKLSRATLFMLLIFSAFGTYVFAQSSVFAPIWMKKGAYAEYSFDDGVRFLSDNTPVEYENGTYRWECIELTGTLAKLNITLSFTEENSVTQYSAEVLVETLNRSVYTMDGTLVGTTNMWLDSNPADDEDVVVWDLPPDMVIAKINHLGGYTLTPQDAQESYEMDGHGTIDGNRVFFSAYYDMDTGIMTTGVVFNDGIFKALSTTLMNIIEFTDTNIDLGPGETIDLSQFEDAASSSVLILIIIVAIAFPFVFVIVYISRRKKYKLTTKR
jgi:hypothetical protein